MATKTRTKRNIPKYIVWPVLALLLFSAIGKRMYGAKEKTRSADSTASNKKAIQFPYRVITALDSSQHLIAYELHKNDSEVADYGAICTKYPKYSAIIKSINPAKDDYKTNCRSIISDIVKTTGNPTLEINIYDDYQAYTLSEENDALEYMSLSKCASDSLLKHIVATYDGYIYGDYEAYGQNYVLAFYPQANNRYSEQEKYEPKQNYDDTAKEKLDSKVRMKLFNQK